MDYVANGRRVLSALAREYEEIHRNQPNSDIYSAGLIDEDRGVYLALSYGWNGKNRVRVVYFLVRLRDDKFWVEEDGSEEGVATHLLNAGVPSDQIVLAFRHPSMRPYTEFAVA